MTGHKPLIFISNDDGYQARGICNLIEIVRPLGDVVVVAPDGGRSGKSCALTTDVPVTYDLVSEEPGLTIYKCSGTPVDCAKLGIDHLVSRQPDLVISGINHGDNASVNAHYSGTVGIIVESGLKGIPSVAFSSRNEAKDADFMPLAPQIRQVVETVLREGLPYLTCLNVNFPKEIPVKGVKVCRMTRGNWHEEWDHRKHPKGMDYSWMVGYFKNYEPEATDTDHWAMDNGYGAITPITLDMTDYKNFEALQGMWGD